MAEIISLLSLFSFSSVSKQRNTSKGSINNSVLSISESLCLRDKIFPLKYL